MSNRLVVAYGVIAAAALGVWLKFKRQGTAVPTGDQQNDLAAGDGFTALPRININDDEAAEIISRARPALDRAAKLL